MYLSPVPAMAPAVTEEQVAGQLHQAELGQANAAVAAGEVQRENPEANPAVAAGEVHQNNPEATHSMVANGEVQQDTPEAHHRAVTMGDVLGSVEVQGGFPTAAVQQGIPVAPLPGGVSSDQMPPLVPGIVVGRPVGYRSNQSPARRLNSRAVARAFGPSELNEEEVIVVNYGASLMIFATIDLFATLLYVIIALVHFIETPGRMRSYNELLWLVFLIGPICGLIGAWRLERTLVFVYFAFCLVKTAYQLAWAVVALQLWHVIAALVQVWVTKIVSTFWRALHHIPPERCRQLLEHKAQATMQYW